MAPVEGTYDAMLIDETGAVCEVGNLELCFDDADWIVRNSTCGGLTVQEGLSILERTSPTMPRTSRELRQVTLLVLGLLGCGRIDFAARHDGPIDPRDASNCSVEVFDTLPATLQIFGSGTVTATNGQLHCTIPATPGIDAGVLTVPNRSFVGTSMAIEVVKTAGYPEAATGPGWHSGASAVHLHVVQGTLVLFDDTGTRAMAPYDPVQHRWLRLRESGGTAYGEHSTDGTTYVPFGTSTAADLTSAYYDLGIAAGSSPPGSDTAIFDHFTTCGP